MPTIPAGTTPSTRRTTIRTSTHRHSLTRATAVVGAAVLVLSARGSGDDDATSEGSEDAGSLIPVNLGGLPIASMTAIQEGIDLGVFEEHGLDVSYVSGQGGAALLPAVTSGEIDIAISNPVSVLLAAGQGLDIRIASGYTHSLAEAPDASAIIVRGDSDIESTADLAGGTVSVNTLNQAGDMNAREAVRLAGGDPNTIEFVEIPFPDAPAQLENGTVDAVWVTEPFVSQLVGMGHRVASWSYLEANPEQPTLVFFTSGSFLDENPEAVSAFQSAIADLAELMNEDSDLFRAAVVAHLDMPEEVVAAMTMEPLTAIAQQGQFERLGELMVQYEVVDQAPDVAALLAPGAEG